MKPKFKALIKSVLMIKLFNKLLYLRGWGKCVISKQAESAVHVSASFLLILLDSLKEIILGDLHGWEKNFYKYN